MDRASDNPGRGQTPLHRRRYAPLPAEVMELCQGAGLYQIDLLGGSKSRVTEREYWAQRKGQLALDTEAAAQGKPPTKFETDKEKLRREIRAVLAVAVSFEDFAQRLLQRGHHRQGEPGPVVLPHPPTGPSPSPPGSWGMTLTAPPLVPLWNTTLPVPAGEPSPASGNSFASPRAFSAWWTLRPRKPRARASATNVGHLCSI